MALTDDECMALGFDRQVFMATPASQSGDRRIATHVYVLTCGEFVKVGIASDIPRRIDSLQAGNPYPIILVAKFPLTSRLFALLCERTIHAVLSPYAHQREWFRCDAERAVAVAAAVHEATRQIRRLHIVERRERSRRWHEKERAKAERRIEQARLYQEKKRAA